jgi:hypothetical protein
MQTYPTEDSPIPIGGGIFVSPGLMQKLCEVVAEDHRRADAGEGKLSRSEIEAHTGTEFGLIAGALGRLRKADQVARRARAAKTEYARRSMIRPACSPIAPASNEKPRLASKRRITGGIDWEAVWGYLSNEEMAGVTA